MVGAALVSLLSVSASSLLRVFYLQQNMKLYPYRLTHLKCVAAGLVAFAAGKIIPEVDNPYFDLVVRGSAVSIVFISLSYLLHISDDLNQVLDKVFKSIKINR